MTNAEIAAELGYERSNIVAMWKTGKTRVALHALKGIAGSRIRLSNNSSRCGSSNTRGKRA